MLRAVENTGIITRTRTRSHPAWMLDMAPIDSFIAGAGSTQAPPARSARNLKADRTTELLTAIAQAGHALWSRDVGAALGLTSPNTRNRWIRRAVDVGLIAPTSDSEFDPARAHTVTDAGRRVLARGMRDEGCDPLDRVVALSATSTPGA